MFCDEVSIEHGDGGSECLDPECTAPHDAHHLQATCASLAPRCPCAVDVEHIHAVFESYEVAA